MIQKLKNWLVEIILDNVHDIVKDEVRMCLDESYLSLKDWLEKEREEKIYYRDLLLKTARITEEKKIIGDSKIIDAFPGLRMSWPERQRELEAREKIKRTPEAERTEKIWEDGKNVNTTQAM